MTEGAGFTKEGQQGQAQRTRKASRTGKQSGGSNAASGASVASPKTSSGTEMSRVFGSHPIWGSQQAVAQAKLGTACLWYQPSQPLDEVPEYVQLNYELLAAYAEQKRMQKELDTMTRRNTSLSSRCSQLERQLQASQAAEASSSAKAAAATAQQLEVMRQQLAEANRFLDQQQETSKQQAAQLQQALSDLAAERERADAATAAAAVFEQELQQIKTRLVASQEQEGVLLEGVQSLTAAGVAKDAALAAAEGRAAQSSNLQQQLAALQQEHQQLQQQYEEAKETNVKVTQALLLVTEQQEEAATTAQHYREQAQHMQQQLAALQQENKQLQQQYKEAKEGNVNVKRVLLLLTEQQEGSLATVQRYKAEAQKMQRQVAAATAARNLAMRDAAATLAAMTHFDGKLAEAKAEIWYLNVHLKAAKAESERLNGVLGEAHKQIAAMPEDVELLKKQVVQLVQQAEMAETLKTISELNRKFQNARWERQWDECFAYAEEAKRELEEAVAAKEQLQEEVVQLRSVLSSCPEASQLLEIQKPCVYAPRSSSNSSNSGSSSGNSNSGSSSSSKRRSWFFGWVVRRQAVRQQCNLDGGAPFTVEAAH